LSEGIVESQDAVGNEPRAPLQYHAIELSWSVVPAGIAGTQEPRRVGL